MAENPRDWYEQCGKYAVENKYSMDFGVLFLLKPNAPENIKILFRKYIELCKKPFHALGLNVYKDKCIVGFLPTDDLFEQEQIEIAKRLIETGYLNNNPYFKFM